jgi:hypothetical protein
LLFLHTVLIDIYREVKRKERDGSGEGQECSFFLIAKGQLTDLFVRGYFSGISSIEIILTGVKTPIRQAPEERISLVRFFGRTKK